MNHIHRRDVIDSEQRCDRARKEYEQKGLCKVTKESDKIKNALDDEQTLLVISR